MGMYTNYNVKITGNTRETEKLYAELNYLKKINESYGDWDEDSARSKDNKLIDTVFYYGFEKNKYLYSDSITWEKIGYEYYLYKSCKHEFPKYDYWVIMNN